MDCAIGVVGLGVMGGNLALNIERHGFKVAGYDVDAARVAAFLAGPASGTRVTGVESAEALAAAIERPRRILLMVPAGPAVDSAIAHLRPHLAPGDIVVDGGNSWFLDTARRARELADGGYQWVGAGISGGEEGALFGPSIMPGGPRAAYDALAGIFEAIAARAEDGAPCVAYMGPLGAGHYVKMVHNGIEYADMQLIAEAYDLLRRGLGLGVTEVRDVFAGWNAGVLESYLIECTVRVLDTIDEETGEPLVDLVLDEAAHKGTGKWTSQNALDVGAPVPTIDAAVGSRLLSARKAERVVASRVLGGPAGRSPRPRQAFIDALRDGLYASKIVAYAQGIGLLRAASGEYAYDLQPATIARIWRAGCIIRARLLGDIMAAFDRDPGLQNLLLDPAFAEAVNTRQAAWRSTVQLAVGLGIPVPATCASLAYYDAYRSERLPANLTQAQRDGFGAHTYRRVDRPGVFHSRWG